MKKNRWLYLILTLSLLLFFSSLASAELLIDTNYQLVNSVRVGRTSYNYTYQVNITNNGTNVQNVSATVLSSSSNTIIIDGDVSFGDVAAGETVTGADTFTIRQDRRNIFDPSVLDWNLEFEE